MIATWMVYGILVTGVLAVSAALLERVAAARRASTRWIWLAAMVGSLVLVASAVSLSSDGAPRNDVAAARTVPPHEKSLRQASTVEVDESAAQPRRWTVGPVSSAALDRPLLVGWAVLSVGTFALLASAAARLRIRRRRWTESSVQGIAVLVTEDTGPAVVGVVRGRIAVPRWLLALAPDRQRLVLEHERQHLVARDPLLIVSGVIVAAMVPWNPILWIMLRRLRTATEIDCDRRVMQVLPRLREYAMLLIDVGARSTGEPTLSPALVAAHSDLERRVTAILDGRPRPLGAMRMVQLLAATALIAAACASPKPAVLIEPAARPTVPVGVSVAARPQAASEASAGTSVARATTVPDTARGVSATTAATASRASARVTAATTASSRPSAVAAVRRSADIVSGPSSVAIATGASTVALGQSRSVTAVAQRSTVGALVITGRVTEAATNSPLEGVQIRVDTGTPPGGRAPPVGANTDARGTYALSVPEELRGTTVTLATARVGYSPALHRVGLADDTTVVDFELEANALRLRNVVTTGAGMPTSVARGTVAGGVDTIGVRRRTVPDTPPGANAYFEFHVEKPAMAIPGGSAPVYPGVLRSANVQGRVLAIFVVDTAGVVDMSTFKELESTHDLFTQAVAAALPRMRFMPAQVSGGRKVKMWVQQAFEFKLDR